MARALSLEVIAEGVENEVQLAELRRLGCDYAQGHLFHAAMPAADVSRLLGEGALGYSGISPEQVVVAEQFARLPAATRSGRCRASSRRRCATRRGSM